MRASGWKLAAAQICHHAISRYADPLKLFRYLPIYRSGALIAMKRAFFILLILFLSAPVLHGKSHRNHTGQLLRMETVRCGPDDGGGVAKAIFGAQVPGPGQEERLCPEYILQAEGLYYRIRPRDHKHPVLLPIGEEAQFHFQKDRMVLQIEDFDEATYEFTVLAIIPADHGESFWPRTQVMIGPPQ